MNLRTVVSANLIVALGLASFSIMGCEPADAPETETDETEVSVIDNREYHMDYDLVNYDDPADGDTDVYRYSYVVNPEPEKTYTEAELKAELQAMYNKLETKEAKKPTVVRLYLPQDTQTATYYTQDGNAYVMAKFDENGQIQTFNTNKQQYDRYTTTYMANNQPEPQAQKQYQEYTKNTINKLIAKADLERVEADTTKLTETQKKALQNSNEPKKVFYTMAVNEQPHREDLKLLVNNLYDNRVIKEINNAPHKASSTQSPTKESSAEVYLYLPNQQIKEAALKADPELQKSLPQETTLMDKQHRNDVVQSFVEANLADKAQLSDHAYVTARYRNDKLVHFEANPTAYKQYQQQVMTTSPQTTH